MVETNNKEKGFIQIIFALAVVAIAGAFLITKYYGYKPYAVGNPNMVPQYAPGQLWALRTNYKNFQRNDVVAFKIPQNPQYSNLARVVGLPGETIMIKGGKVFINDRQLEEPYLSPNTTTGDGQLLPEGDKKTIPQDQYAVLADNRSKGIDTRDYGFIASNNFIGKLAFCYKNCNKSDSSITASFEPNLKADEILKLINQYRQSKKLQSWTTSQELCNLAEKRANYLVSNQREPLKASQTDFQKNFEDQVKSYTGVSINEIHISDIATNQEAVDGWKKFPDNNKFLLMTEANGAQITKACASVKVDRAFSLVVLMSGSDTSSQASKTSNATNQVIPATQQPSGPGYNTKTDIDNLVRDLNQADQDYKTINDSYKGSSSYNQTTINRILQIIPQRKALAQSLLDKMGKGQSLTQADFSTWDQYDALTAEQNNLVKTLYNGNGGF